MKKVLMASPSSAFLKRNKILLMDKGFQFCTATSVSEALKLHDEHKFDLILSDLEQGGMDGCCLCSEIRKKEDGENVPVIIICHDSAQHIQKIQQSDAAAILLRPINPTHLLITIGSFIDMQLARSKRVEFDAPAFLQKTGRELAGTACDISATGISLAIEYQLDLGDVLNCRFKLLDIGEIQTAVKVIRCNDSLDNKSRNVYGFSFIDLSFSNRNAITKYVSLHNHLAVKHKIASSSLTEHDYQLNHA